MNTTNCPDLEELKELKSVIEDVLRERSADLEGLFSDDDSCLKNLCSQLFQKKIVTETTKVNPTFHKIMKDFKNCMNYMKNKEKFRMHCISFITSLRSLGGPAVGAAEGLETEWTVAIQKKLKFDLRIEKKPKAEETNTAGVSLTLQQLIYLYYAQQQQRSSLCGIPGGEHVPLHLPPYPPSSSALIRQNLQHNPSFGNTIFTRVKENASHRYTKSLNTLWHDEAERFHNNMEPESIDYDILGYANEPQESKEKSPGVWVRQGGFYWDPEQLKSEQMVYRGENHLSRHAYTDPSFMPNKSDQFVPPSLYDQHLCETASITTSQSESTGQPELTEPTTLSKQVTTATSEDHSEQFLVRSRNGNMSHAPSLLTKLNHMQFELDNLKTTVEQLAHSKINFNEETKNGHDSSCAMAGKCIYL